MTLPPFRPDLSLPLLWFVELHCFLLGDEAEIILFRVRDASFVFLSKLAPHPPSLSLIFTQK